MSDIKGLVIPDDLPDWSQDIPERVIERLSKSQYWSGAIFLGGAITYTDGRYNMILRVGKRYFMFDEECKEFISCLSKDGYGDEEARIDFYQVFLETDREIVNDPGRVLRE